VSQCLDYQFDGEWIILSAYEKVKVGKEQENNIQKDKYYRSLQAIGNAFSEINWLISSDLSIN